VVPLGYRCTDKAECSLLVQSWPATARMTSASRSPQT
jgi:hypothetical protein